MCGILRDRSHFLNETRRPPPETEEASVYHGYISSGEKIVHQAGGTESGQGIQCHGQASARAPARLVAEPEGRARRRMYAGPRPRLVATRTVPCGCGNKLPQMGTSQHKLIILLFSGPKQVNGKKEGVSVLCASCGLRTESVFCPVRLSRPPLALGRRPPRTPARPGVRPFS